MKKTINMSIKKTVIMGIILIAIFSLIFAIIIKSQYKEYSRLINDNINKIINKVIEKYPEVKEDDILEIVRSTEPAKENILQKYGYEEEIANIKEMKTKMEHNITKNVMFVIACGISYVAVYTVYVLIQEKKVKSINEYIMQVNHGNYSLKIEENGEGELSKLRNELYKTTVLLKETAENSEKEKKNLSNSLADISHQLKTPLTSIRIMLDNISDNPDMEEEVRNEFLTDISKQIDWISSLVISLLKMAKFDAGTIKMEDKKINVKSLIENVIDNLSILIEIKNLKIITKVNEDATFVADYKWQLEAITNILKNSIEHTKTNTKIYIIVEDTSVFLKIIIKDEGQGINKKDLKHIFERFYKSQNSNEDSIGIGLALAKTIIEKSNGYIKVDSEIGKGTTFEMKYLK